MPLREVVMIIFQLLFDFKKRIKTEDDRRYYFDTYFDTEVYYEGYVCNTQTVSVFLICKKRIKRF